MKTNKFKKGKYYIGDPSYVFSTDNWMNFTSETDWLESPTFKGKPYLANNTEYGDGVYFDKENRTYAVDSGCLSIIPYSVASKDNTETFQKIKNKEIVGDFILGQIIDFKEDFEGEIIGHKIFKFGHIEIDVDYDGEGEDE